MTKADLDDILFVGPRLPLAILTAVALLVVATYIILEGKVRDWVKSIGEESDAVDKW